VLLHAILEIAHERELIPRNTAKGKRRRVRTSKPRRLYLDTAGQIAALLAAAAELDREAKRYRHIRRHAMLAVLVFAGLRLGELLRLRWRDVDLAAGRLRIADAKTDAGHRDVTLRPVLRDVLAALKADARDLRPAAFVFGSTSGRRLAASNVRRRVLAAAVEHANERLEEDELPPIPGNLTPRSLRRTFASVLYALGEPPTVVMAEIGHTHPGLALRIYAEAMRRDSGETERLRTLVEGGDLADIGRRPDRGPAARGAGPEAESPESRSGSGLASDGWARLGSNQRPLACEAFRLRLQVSSVCREKPVMRGP